MNAALLDALGRELARASVVAVVVVGGAAGVLALLRGLAPRWKAWVWWLVAARLLAELAGVPAIELPLLAPAGSVRFEPAPVDFVRPRAAASETASDITTVAAAPISVRRWTTPSVWTAAALFWIAGALAASALFVRRARRWRHLMDRAERVTDAPSLAALARAEARIAFAGKVDLRRSDEIATPMVVGLLRPVVLVPAAEELAGEDLALALEHELVHLRRRDAWRALVPALAGRLLFFHPLARLAEREYRLATEAACDAEVLARDAAASERYGRLLVRFAAPGDPPSTVTAWSFASPPIFRRLDMMIQSPFDRRRLAFAAPLLVLLVAAVAVPLRLVAEPAPAATPVAELAPEPDSPEAASAAEESLPARAPAAPLPTPEPGTRMRRASRSGSEGWSWTSAPPAPPAPPAAPAWPAPIALAAPVPAVAPVPGVAPVAPVPAVAPVARVPAPPPVPAWGEIDAVDALVLVDGDMHFSVDATREQQRLAHRLADDTGKPVALLERDGKLYVVRDARTIREIEGAIEQQTTLARRQAAVARDQAGVARRQAQAAAERARGEAMRARAMARDDARRMASEARRQAERSAALSRELAASGASPALAANAERLRDIQRQLDELERDLERLQVDRQPTPAPDAAGVEELDRQLRDEMERYASQQEELAREMSRQSREVGRSIDAALDRAFDAGLAVPIERPRP